MPGTKPVSEPRRRRARQALAGLGLQRSESLEVGVQCQHSHHLAAVYLTSEGLVYVARVGPHSHGSKDRIDTGSHGKPAGEEYVDLLDAHGLADDALPAWCDCGSRTLSRRELQAVARAGRHSLRVR